ncbi:substrate-binding domain-containing protein [Nocardioides sp. B-3]|uniref:substrate-binding domain-containing protein n=1 Tax=Nocardioides sp. B-3 TaxID=2895565 RepID=UPI0021532EBD|nr:substrate-binding domain-containing protein [Nocardioides sp. B-3]UUZ58031.1 substrate-binding domain-containing protein [Nocardioides sp. B-3]
MFGSHATSTPEPTDLESADPGSGNTRLAVIGVVLALVVASGWFVVSLFGDDGSAAADCTAADVTTVTMAVAPAMADPVDEAVDAMGESAQCIELEVTTATVAEVSAAQDEVDEGEVNALPDLWVPDSPARQLVLSDAGLTGKAIVPALATTPVGLASGSEDPRAPHPLEALSSPRLVKNDPKENGASALAMVAPFSEAAEGIGDIATAQRSIVPVAQRFGAKVAAGRLRPITIDTIPGGSKRLIPVTERDFLIAKRGNDALTRVEPGTGVAVLNFPLVQPNAGEGGIGVGTGSLDVAGRTGERLAQWFTTEEGLAAIAGDQLRAPDGGPLPDDESVTTSKQLPAAESSRVRATMESWFTLTVPSSIPAVLDVSGAMSASVGGTTRLSLATGGAPAALWRAARPRSGRHVAILQRYRRRR